MPALIALVLVALALVAVVAFSVVSVAGHVLFSPLLLVAIAVAAWLWFRPRRPRRPRQ